MNKVSETINNILYLRTVRERLQGDDLRRVDRVLRSLRGSLGETVSKSSAAELLGVSRQTLDRWISEGVLPVIRLANGRQQVLSSALERVLVEIHDIREKGISQRVLPDLRTRKDDSAAKPAAAKPAAAKPAAAKGQASQKKAVSTSKKKAVSTSKKKAASTSKKKAVSTSQKKAVSTSQKKAVSASQKKAVPASQKKPSRARR